MKGCIRHIAKWQILLFISKVTTQCKASACSLHCRQFLIRHLSVTLPSVYIDPLAPTLPSPLEKNLVVLRFNVFFSWLLVFTPFAMCVCCDRWRCHVRCLITGLQPARIPLIPNLHCARVRYRMIINPENTDVDYSRQSVFLLAPVPPLITIC